MSTPTDQPEANRHGLVTGASSGLGLAVARAAASQGMRVTLVARDAKRLQRATELVRAANKAAQVATLTADLSAAGEPARVAAEAASLQPLDFVCHAAGLSTRGAVTATPRDDLERLMAINFYAAAELAGAVAEGLAERNGRLVLIGSLASRVGPAWLGGYPASKHAVAALAQQLRMELGPKGLRTLLVCPGPIARDDAGTRYDAEATDLPESARRPGGGAKVKAIDPDWLAERILRDSRTGRRDLVVPAKARVLFALTQLSPSLGDWLLRRSMGES